MGLNREAFDGVLCFWPLDEIARPGPDAAPMPASLGPVAHTVRSLAFHVATRSPRLWLITRGAQAANQSQARVNSWQAPVWGLGFAIAFEHPDLGCTRLDLDPDAPADATAARAIAEFVRRGPYGDQYVHRGEVFLRRRLDRQVLGRSSAADLSAEGAHLITGGWGAIGLSLAEGLARAGARHLVLLGRHSPTSEGLARVESVRSSGVVVDLVSVDVADYAALSVALDEVRRKGGRILGVFHAAGVLEDTPVIDVTEDVLERVSAPKVAGAWNLHILTRDDPLDHFVLFSSASAALGSIGQAAYMSANAFLGALAEERSRSGLPSLSIDWGPWAEDGMAATALETGRGVAVAGVSMISHRDGVDTLLAMLDGSSIRAVVLPFDLKTLIHVYPAAMGISLFEKLFGDDFHQLRNDGAANVIASRPELAQPYVESRNRLESLIAGIWQRALGIDRVGVRDPFFELGGDSVFAGQVLTQINKALGVTLDTEAAFESFTVEKLAELAELALLKEVESVSEEEALKLLAEEPRHEQPSLVISSVA
jgi:NAD(P)-dependent dehydrogenase (short-subunit alcohol dehydrogenase family)/acyl carrier protein